MDPAITTRVPARCWRCLKTEYSWPEDSPLPKSWDINHMHGRTVLCFGCASIWDGIERTSWSRFMAGTLE